MIQIETITLNVYMLVKHSVYVLLGTAVMQAPAGLKHSDQLPQDDRASDLEHLGPELIATTAASKS